MRTPLWTPEETRILTAANEAGKNDIEVSEMLPGRTREACGTRRRGLGLPCNPVPYTISRFPPDVWTEADIAVATRLRAAGQTDAEIGRALKRTEGAVKQKLHLIGIAKPNVRPYHQEKQIKAPPPEDYRFEDHPRPFLRGETAVVVRGPGLTLPSRYSSVQRASMGCAAAMCAGV